MPVMRGPVVYCAESADNGDYIRDIRLDTAAAFETESDLTFGIPSLKIRAYRREAPKDSALYIDGLSPLKEITARLIPYYAFANRGASEMQVWHSVIIK